jgi:hypothetical protein
MMPTFQTPAVVYVILQGNIPVAVTHHERFIPQLLRDYSVAPNHNTSGIRAEVRTYERVE